MNTTRLTYSHRRWDTQGNSLVFSLDLPAARSPDCYRIEGKESSFVLSKVEKRVCSGGPHLAIAVLSQDPDDVVAVLSRNGIYPSNNGIIVRKSFYPSAQ